MKLGEKGIEEIIEISLTTDERAAFQNSVKAAYARGRACWGVLLNNTTIQNPTQSA